MILYGHTITKSMQVMIDETVRRRAIQSEYHRVHGITPETIKKRIYDLEYQIAKADYLDLGMAAEEEEIFGDESEMEKTIEKLDKEMKAAAKSLEFERAAKLRDKIRALRRKELQMGGTVN